VREAVQASCVHGDKTDEHAVVIAAATLAASIRVPIPDPLALSGTITEKVRPPAG
jgi:DUF4097 and DUF4098 domain-containing protein YvlB